MKILTTKILLSVVSIAMFSGCGPSSYNGLVNVVAVGAGEQPTSTTDKNYINAKSLPNIVVYYTPSIKIKEQDVSKSTKYIAGDALIREYSGEPKLMVEYLNAYQKFENKVLILDKHGIVAWSGFFRTADVTTAVGVYDYGFTGADRISFTEAMEKFVLDGDKAEFDDDKNIEFPIGNKGSLMSGFSNSKKYPLLMTKLPDMNLGTTNLSNIISNNKPTVLIFFMSKDTIEGTLKGDTNKAGDFLGNFTDTGHSGTIAPQNILNDIEEIYFEKK